MHLDAGARPLGQRVGELPADLAGPVDVGLERDRCRAPRIAVEHRRKDLVAVLQALHTVAVHDRRAEQDAEFATELRVADSIAVLQ